MIVYVSVGNDGLRLSQPQWAIFATQAEGLLIGPGKILSTWYSTPTAPWQSACWRIEFDDQDMPGIPKLRDQLANLAARFSQPVHWDEVTRPKTIATPDEP